MQEKLIVLGTGHATVTKCYNTCFAIETEMKNEKEYFLVDAGGGNGILTQLEKANISIEAIQNMFVTHAHTDHILGVIWMIRMVATSMLKGKYQGEFIIYCHKELEETIRTFTELTLAKKHLACMDQRIHFQVISDMEEKKILSMQIRFFDIHSTKAKQFGCIMELSDGERVMFPGDEPLSREQEPMAKDVKWLIHEAFCLKSQEKKYKPYEKHHSTAFDAGETARRVNAKNLILWHSEDDNLENKGALYSGEAEGTFEGNVFVPADFDIIIL